MTGDLSYLTMRKSEGRKILGKKRKSLGYGSKHHAKSEAVKLSTQCL